MCTLTYFPISIDRFFIHSNRDESINRTDAVLPQWYASQNKIRVWMPIDPEGQGSWMGANNLGNICVLLNGALEKHERLPSYRHSRGLIVKDFLQNHQPEIYLEKVDLTDIEPFTLIVFSTKKETKIILFIWDGNRKIISYPSPDIPHIWSATMLYNKTIRDNSSKSYFELLAKGNITRKSLQKFNKHESYKLKVSRNGQEPFDEVRTLSFTSIYVNIEKNKFSGKISNKNGIKASYKFRFKHD